MQRRGGGVVKNEGFREAGDEMGERSRFLV